MSKKITYEFKSGLHEHYVRFNAGKNNLPKSGIASIKSWKENLAYKWGVPVEEIEVNRVVEDEPEEGIYIDPDDTYPISKIGPGGVIT